MISLIDIIILNYYKENITFKCLRSLQKQTFNKFRVILIDNGSHNPQSFKDEVLKFKLSILYLNPKRNLGFANGVNFALKYTNALFIALVNNDAVLSPTFLEKTLNFLKENVNYAAVSPWILDDQGIWFAYAYIKPWERHFTAHSRKHPNIHKKSVIDCDYIPLTSALIRRKVLLQLNNFSKDFFMYYEDALFGIKARELGYKLASYPEILVFHSTSSSTTSDKRQFFIYRSRIIFMSQVFKNFALVLAIITFFRNIVRDFFTDFIRNNRLTTRYRLFGITSGLRYLVIKNKH